MMGLPVWLLIICFSLTLSVFWVAHRANVLRLPQSQALELAMILMVASFLGARAFHVLYEEPYYYWSNPLAILKIWEGGMVFYGGLLLGALAFFAYGKWRNLSMWQWADFFAPIIAFNYALGRVGCFVNGCCYGKVCDLPWAVTFSSHAVWGIQVIPRHPTQLYAALWEVCLCALLLWLERTRSTRRAGQLFLFWLCGHAIGRLVMEHWRDDDRGLPIAGMSVSSWISAALLVVAASCLIMRRRTFMRMSTHLRPK